MQRWFPWLLTLAVVVSSGSPAAACPDCATARAARQRVLDRDFGTNLLIASAPFVLIGLVAAGAHRVGRGAVSTPAADDHRPAGPRAGRA